MAQDELTKFKVVVIGGSAGSLEVVMAIIASLPADPRAIVIIVVHRKNDSESVLEHLLSHKTRLPVTEVEDKEPIIANAVYIAPPDYHLLMENEANFSLDTSEKVHYSRPSIDVTFESVAETFGDRVIGILLSGSNADGANGLAVIKDRGGYTIVQDPSSADVGFMPQQAINRGCVDVILHGDKISEKLNSLLTA